MPERAASGAQDGRRRPCLSASGGGLGPGLSSLWASSPCLDRERLEVFSVDLPLQSPVITRAWGRAPHGRGVSLKPCTSSVTSGWPGPPCRSRLLPPSLCVCPACSLSHAASLNRGSSPARWDVTTDPQDCCKAYVRPPCGRPSLSMQAASPQSRGFHWGAPQFSTAQHHPRSVWTLALHFRDVLNWPGHPSRRL